MEEAEARAQLESMLQWESEPALTQAEVEQLLAACRRPDTDGLVPTDEAWTGTFALNAAAAEGWRWKAGKVVGRFAFGTDGQSFQRQQIREGCLAMADYYRNRSCGSIPLNIGSGELSDVAGNVDGF